MPTFVHRLLVLHFIFILYTSLVNGYVISRLTSELRFPRLRLLNSVDDLAPLPLVISEAPSLNDVPLKRRSQRSFTTRDELKRRLERLIDAEGNESTQRTGYTSSKKFNNTGSRNCFFTPIQCLVQFDLDKYRKLVDTSSNMHADFSSPVL